MIELFYWPTPNGNKILLFLEEASLPYRIQLVDIGKGDQFSPHFMAISPNSRIPAIVDHGATDGESPQKLFESGAILLYLAEKTGLLFPDDLRGRIETLQWLFWQVGGLGPMAGQANHFCAYANEIIPYAIDRYMREATRLYGVLDRRLADRPFVTGDHYTIADIAIYPWIVQHDLHRQDLASFRNISRWHATIAQRPATIRAYDRAERVGAPKPGTASETARRFLFGRA